MPRIVTSFRYRRRVEFAETDMVGLVHFSMFFRYMEEAEHALWRAAGLSIARPGEDTGWPRVAAAFDFQSPLRFEDEFDVLVRIERVGRRTIEYAFTIVCGDTRIGTGTISTAFVTWKPGERMRALDLPTDILERLQRALA